MRIGSFDMRQIMNGRRISRRIACFLLAGLLFLTVLPLPAAAAKRDLTYEQLLATDLKSLGLFAGVSDTDFALGRAPTRVEALVMLIRLLGIEREVTSGAWTHPFTDVPGWADKYVGYAYTAGLTSGESATRFGAGDASAAMYLTFVLRALGYTDRGEGAQFAWDDPFALARKTGILPEQTVLSPFWRADVVIVSYAALRATMNDTGEPLSKKLIAGGVFTEERFALSYHPEYLTLTDTSSQWTPLSALNVGYGCGYAEPIGTLDDTVHLNYTVSGSILAVAGTRVRPVSGTRTLGGFEIWQFDANGHYVNSIGDLFMNRSELTTTISGFIIIHAYWGSEGDMRAAAQDVGAQFRLCFPKEQQLFAWSNPQSYHPFTFERGTIQPGAPTDSENRLRSTDFLTVGAGTRVFLPDFRYAYHILRYDADGKLVDVLTDGWRTGQAYTIGFDCKIKLLVLPKLNGEVTEQDAQIVSRSVAVDLRAPSPEFAYLPPNYYFTNNYLPDRVAKVNEFTADAALSDQFMFITDIHWDTNGGRSPALTRYVAEHTGVKRVIFGGDAITSFSTKEEAITALRSVREKYGYFTGERWISALGNHEFNNPGAGKAKADFQLTAQEAREAFTLPEDDADTVVDPMLSYWDNTQARIRYFLLGYDYNSTLPAKTVMAFLTELTKVPQGYNVVLISHAGLSYSDMPAVSMRDVIGALDAVRNQTAYYYHNKKYDYSKLTGVTAICVLSGHRHKDGAYVTTTGLPVISTVSDGYVAYKSSSQNDIRSIGVVEEQAFDVVQIDLASRRIDLTRIGAGKDRSFTY